MVTPGSLHPLIDVEQVNFEWGVHIGGSFVQTCAGVRRFPPWVAHKGPSLRCPRAPPQVPLSAPRCSPAPPLTPDLSHHTATYWVALAGNHKTPPPTAPALSPRRYTGVQCKASVWVELLFITLIGQNHWCLEGRIHNRFMSLECVHFGGEILYWKYHKYKSDSKWEETLSKKKLANLLHLTGCAIFQKGFCLVQNSEEDFQILEQL